MVALLDQDWPKFLLKSIKMCGEGTNDLPIDFLPIGNKKRHLLYILAFHAMLDYQN
jgi:hypothetical protein